MGETIVIELCEGVVERIFSDADIAVEIIDRDEDGAEGYLDATTQGMEQIFAC